MKDSLIRLMETYLIGRAQGEVHNNMGSTARFQMRTATVYSHPKSIIYTSSLHYYVVVYFRSWTYLMVREIAFSACTAFQASNCSNPYSSRKKIDPPESRLFALVRCINKHFVTHVTATIHRYHCGVFLPPYPIDLELHKHIPAKLVIRSDRVALLQSDCGFARINT